MSFTMFQSLLKFMFIESVMPSNHLILCLPLLLLPSIFPNEPAFHIRWPQYWSFSFSISPSNEYSVLISFRIDWFHILAVQGTLKSCPAPQFKNITSWVYTTTRKTRALTIRTSVSKVVSLLFNTLSSFVTAFLQRSKYF